MSLISAQTGHLRLPARALACRFSVVRLKVHGVEGAGVYWETPINELNEPPKEIFHLFSTGFGSTFSPTLQSPHVLIATPTDMQGLEVLCVPLSANTFLLAAAYHARRDAARRLGLLAL